MSKINYPIGDFLIRLKNAAIARHKKVAVNPSNFIRTTALVLKKEGYLDDVLDEGGKIVVSLSYRKKEPVLLDVKLVSKPGLRVYISVDELQKKRGPEVAILSTPLGVMSIREALKKRVGGEIIAEVL